MADLPTWRVVRVVDVSESRRRLEYWIDGLGKHYATIDRELDTPQRRKAIVDAIVAERYVAKTPRGPEPRPAPAPSPWLEQ